MRQSWENDDNDDAENYKIELNQRYLEYQLDQRKLDIDLMAITVEMLKSSFWWRFMSFDKKSKLILKGYDTLHYFIEVIGGRVKQEDTVDDEYDDEYDDEDDDEDEDEDAE